MVKKILSEGVEYFYIIDPLETDLNEYQPLSGENAFQKFNLNNIERIRMVLIPNTISGKGYFLEYLYWIEPIDLEDLDKKIINNTYSDKDFEESIKTYFLENIRCQNCQNEYDGFAVDHGNPYIGNKELLKVKNDKIFNSHVNLKCPNCNSPLRITILKFIP